MLLPLLCQRECRVRGNVHVVEGISRSCVGRFHGLLYRLLIARCPHDPCVVCYLVGSLFPLTRLRCWRIPVCSEIEVTHVFTTCARALIESIPRNRLYGVSFMFQISCLRRKSVRSAQRLKTSGLCVARRRVFEQVL